MGEPAYQGISKMQVMFGVVSEGLRPVFPPNTPPWYAQIAEVCWRREPKRRYNPWLRLVGALNVMSSAF